MAPICWAKGRCSFATIERCLADPPLKWLIDPDCATMFTELQVVLENGRVRGAMLIGDTGLAETFENLILNAIDVSEIGVDLLSLDVDIEDFFD